MFNILFISAGAIGIIFSTYKIFEKFYEQNYTYGFENLNKWGKS